MADITKCMSSRDGFICPDRETCYRYMAPETPEWQSYFIDIPYDEINETCNDYWKC